MKRLLRSGLPFVRADAHDITGDGRLIVGGGIERVEMAHENDVTRVLAACEECDSVYTAWQWPSGKLKVVGQAGCRCGSTAFTPVEEAGDTDSTATPESE